jgi:hypothetical protein
MRFTVPQFIDYEAKMFWFFTFKQFVYVMIAGAICALVYLTAPFSVFILSCIVLGGGAMAFAFLKIGGRSLATVLANFLKFKISPKMFIWHKKEMTATVFKKEGEEIKEEPEEEEKSPLIMSRESRLKKLSVDIETKTK